MASLTGKKRDCDDDGVTNCKKLKDDNGGKLASEEHAVAAHVATAVETAEDQSVDVHFGEPDVGITDYVGKHAGFNGVIKQRYSDFVVAEIDLEGRLARLDNTDIPKEENNLPEMEDVLDEDTICKLRCLSSDGDKTSSVDIDVENFDKERRRIVHEILRRSFDNLESNTEEKEARKTIVVTRMKTGSKEFHGSNLKFQKGIRQSWPAFRGNYTHFTLYKENVDTIEGINIIAKYLGVKPGAFTYAGVKDKRAKTFQRVSIYRTEAIKLVNLNKRLRNMLIGNIGYFKDPLKLGDLAGNRFQIVLRNVEGPSEVIETAMNCLSEVGFLNYFGMQRFGTTSIPTHAIGLALLKGDWKLAVELVLKPRPGEDESMAKARQLWLDTGDATKAFALLRRKNSNEGHLLRGLQIHGTKDLVNALNFIPRNMRLMYIHSYQSHVWNRIVSRRVQKYGLATVDGDLVAKTDDDVQNEESEICQLDKSGPEVKAKLSPTVLQVNHTCSIYDIVLPLVGYDIKYPNNEIADWYREMLCEDGLDIDNMRHRVKAYALSGSYRRIIVRPKDIHWSTLRYDDPKIALVRTDYDDFNEAANTDSDSKDNGALQAIKLDFRLPPSCYATMALREILRIDTSSAFQSNLNRT